MFGGSGHDQLSCAVMWFGGDAALPPCFSTVLVPQMLGLVILLVTLALLFSAPRHIMLLIYSFHHGLMLFIMFAVMMCRGCYHTVH